jgi:6-pyruvoyltetrahydropterin/6-carboxytetrahydropterin synthase
MPKILVFKEFTFYAAHSVSCFGVEHKCNRIHGHTYHLRVTVGSDLEHPYEFGVLEKDCLAIIGVLDHSNLNDHSQRIGGEPTTERLATWIFDELRKTGCPVFRVELRETNTSGVVIEQ